MTLGERGLRPLEHLVGLPLRRAEQVARDLGWDVRVMRKGTVYPAGPFRPDRANLHTDDNDRVLGVSIG
jgi:hypothetical protein